MKNWFSSDWHLGHKNILQYDKRPFDCIQEHDAAILYNYRSLVKKEDNFYFLGDFTLGSLSVAEYFLSIMPGNKFFIKGNHDNRDMIKLYKRYGTYLGYMEEIKVQGKTITLCHYSLRVWNKSHHGAWHLYGHSHGSLEHIPNGKSFDIAINLWDYKPLSFEQVQEEMDKRVFVPIDHHR